MGITRKTAAAWATGTLAILTLSACGEDSRFNLVERLNLQATKGEASDTATGAGKTVQEDVEAPEVFFVSEEGLWDGRPSLGGIWVAHPDVTEPERVIIRNISNGKDIVGALFRREIETPGPRLQVSSDAAEALSMQAGTPQELSVTALRRKEVPLPETDLDPADVEAVDAPDEVTQTTLDPAAITEAAVDASSEEIRNPTKERNDAG